MVFALSPIKPRHIKTRTEEFIRDDIFDDDDDNDTEHSESDLFLWDEESTLLDLMDKP